MQITYDKKLNAFLIHVKFQLPVFRALKNTTVTNFKFLKNLSKVSKSDTLKITQIKSERFSQIQGPDLPHSLYYHSIKYDKLTQIFIVRADTNSDYFDSSIIDCLDKVTTNVCPYESYRSNTNCVVEKYTTTCQYKFIHFSSSEPIIVSAIDTNYHGVLFKEKFNSDRLSKIFPRYNKTPLQIKCGASSLNLGIDPSAEEVKIHLESLTSEYDELEKINLKQIKQNDKLQTNIANLSDAINSLDTDATLSLGNTDLVDTKSLKYIVVALTSFVALIVSIYIIKKCKNAIVTFWRNRYRTRPIPAPRYQNIRLSNRNINRAVATNT